MKAMIWQFKKWIKNLPPVRFWNANFLQCELALSIALTVLFIIWSELFDGKSLIIDLILDNRMAIYGTLATIYGTLLGFIITAVSIIIGYSNNASMAPVTRSRHYMTLWKTYMKTTKVLSIATVVSIISLIIDHKGSINWLLFYLNVYLFILLILRLSRSVQFFNVIIQINAMASSQANVKSSQFNPSSRINRKR